MKIGDLTPAHGLLISFFWWVPILIVGALVAWLV